ALHERGEIGVARVRVGQSRPPHKPVLGGVDRGDGEIDVGRCVVAVIERGGGECVTDLESPGEVRAPPRLLDGELDRTPARVTRQGLPAYGAETKVAEQDSIFQLEDLRGERGPGRPTTTHVGRGTSARTTSPFVE